MSLMSIVLAGMLSLGTPDNPARFSGLASVMVSGGPAKGCTAAFRSEDLPDPHFKNRFHILLRGCDLPAWEGWGWVKVFAQTDGTMLIALPEWGQVVCDPLDEGIKEWMKKASTVPPDNPLWQHLTVRPLAPGLTELLIEEPAR